MTTVNEKPPLEIVQGNELELGDVHVVSVVVRCKEVEAYLN